jgi:hypothetical protein
MTLVDFAKAETFGGSTSCSAAEGVPHLDRFLVTEA